MAAAMLTFGFNIAHAETQQNTKKTYPEMAFIQQFKGQNQKFVLETLGKPARKQTPVKPTNSDGYVGKPSDGQGNNESIEMWYYTDLVRYNSKSTFKQTELTFVNDVISNITFVNR